MPQPWGSSLRAVFPVQTGAGGKNMGFGEQTGERSAVGCCEDDRWVGKIPLEKEMATHSRLLPGKSHGWRSLWATVHGVAKELDTSEQL